MNLAWKLVIFTFIINICAGIVINVLGMQPNSAIGYNSAMVDELDVYDVQSGKQSIYDTSVAYTDFNWAENLLNIVGLGFLIDLMNLLSRYLYGIVPIILSFLPGDSMVYETYLKGFITLIYTISLFVIFTGKDITGEG